jgi:aquaporin Z
MRRYLTEFIGTFFLVLTVCFAVRTGSALAPLGIAAILVAMIFAGGHISGAHYNPAVTLAVFLRGRISLVEGGFYMAAQVVGGLVAAVISLLVLEGPADAFSATGRAMIAAFVVELLFTFALALVMLNVATSRSHPNNSFYGLAIGFTVLAGAVAVGAISGGVFNPAVAIGGVVAGLLSWSMLPIYLVATFAGGALAGLTFKAMNPGDA